MGWLGDRPSGVSGAGDGSEQREAAEAERGRERVGGGGSGEQGLRGVPGCVSVPKMGTLWQH